VKPVRFTKSARKHRIGKAAAHYVMATAEPESIVSKTGASGFGWRGLDNRDRELEITAIDLPDCLLVIHVMPTHYRKDRS
jgi:hypothetical protein